jgi:hypothetical protein
MPNPQALQVFYGTVPLVAAILLAIWSNNKRLDDVNKRIDDLNKRTGDLKGSIDKRIDDLAAVVNAGFTDVKTALNKLEARVADLEKGTRLIRG